MSDLFPRLPFLGLLWASKLVHVLESQVACGFLHHLVQSWQITRAASESRLLMMRRSLAREDSES